MKACEYCHRKNTHLYLLRANQELIGRACTRCASFIQNDLKKKYWYSTYVLIGFAIGGFTGVLIMGLICFG